ncbi:hypothetical protein JD844_015338 [Phrynosoma platyrhinos]|uniref:Uncharacterized protein n=1 Tax=Phrynosoma platyrhinos TaxID=52577 RepID=A0ABQ7SJ10_PHRPL|nr:hypothetical protein JD844_015338 [Phrynosoma platyrhinos]
MAQSGYIRGSHSSPNVCKCKQDHRRLDGVRQGPCPGANAVDDDWETDSDYVNNGSSRWSGDHEISTASIIADFSRAIREGSLGRSSWHSKKEYADLQGHHRGCKHSEGNYLEDHHPLPRLHGHVAPGPSIDRTSLFHRNTAEKLDSFFSERLRVWGSDTAQQSATHEKTEGAQEERDVHRRHNGKGHTNPKEASMRQTHGWMTDGSGDTVAECPQSSRETCHPHVVCQGTGLWHPWHSLTGKGRASEGPLSKQEGSRPSTTMSSSARILPRCRISHVQRCRACQAFNQNQPASPYENCWTTLQEEDQGVLSDPLQKERTPPSSARQQISDRLSTVQHWLERTPVERPPGPDPWRRQRHSVQRTSPATCACLFCEEQRPRTRLVTGKTRPDPSADEVSHQLPEENRISGIVEAFERWTLQEAKMAEQERAFESERQRDLERRKAEKRRGRGPKAGRDPKRDHRSSSTKAHKSHSKKKNEEEEDRKKHGESRTREDPKGKEGLWVRKRPSFMDRLRGIR